MWRIKSTKGDYKKIIMNYKLKNKKNKQENRMKSKEQIKSSGKHDSDKTTNNVLA